MKKLTIILIFWTLYPFTSYCRVDELRVVKSAKTSNPTIFIKELDNNKMIADFLKNDLYYSDWFDVINSSKSNPASKPVETDYTISGFVADNNGKKSVAISLIDNKSNILTEFQKKGLANTTYKMLTQSAVNEVINHVFDNPGFCLSKLAYVKKINNNKEIWISDFDGSDPRQLTFNKGTSIEPSWSHGNKYMIYTLYKSYSTNIVLIDLFKGLQRRLTNISGFKNGASISNHNTTVIMTLSKNKKVDLYSVDITKGTVMQLTNDNAAEASPCWSPDDREICYVSDKYGGKPRLFIVPSTGGTARKLIKRPVECVSPDWSVVSNKICFVIRDSRQYKIAYIDMSENTQSPVIITHQPGDWEEPSWTADGRHIVCSRTLGGQKALFLVDSLYKKTIPLKNYSGEDSLPDCSNNFVN